MVFYGSPMKKLISILMGIALVSAGSAFGQNAAEELVPVEGTCKAAEQRFPDKYAKFSKLKNVGRGQRTQRVTLLVKDRSAGLFIEATLQEIDLDNDGICDLVVTTRDPIGSGGDSDVLTSLYFSGNGPAWKRIGAASAQKSDLPSELDLMKSPDDANYAFSEFVAIRHRPSGRTYLVAWNHERVANGQPGYAILELNEGKIALHPLDKWNPPGAPIYAYFKTMKTPDGGKLFEPQIEAGELRFLCQKVPTRPDRPPPPFCK